MRMCAQIMKRVYIAGGNSILGSDVKRGQDRGLGQGPWVRGQR